MGELGHECSSGSWHMVENMIRYKPSDDSGGGSELGGLRECVFELIKISLFEVAGICKILDLLTI